MALYNVYIKQAHEQLFTKMFSYGTFKEVEEAQGGYKNALVHCYLLFGNVKTPSGTHWKWEISHPTPRYVWSDHFDYSTLF